MLIQLPPDMQEYVRTEVESGRAASADEFVTDSLRKRQLEESEPELDPVLLRKLIMEAEEQFARGEFVELTDELIADMKRSGRERLAQKSGMKI